MAGHDRAGPRSSGGGRVFTGARVRPAFAALDLGTNNCRLLVAEPAGSGFRVIDGYSQIVRLGEGVSGSGRLTEAAMARTFGALSACAERIARRKVAAVGCIATQACRAAANGPDFLERVRRELGLSFELISPEHEARLAVLGCASLIDPNDDAALIVDIGGGSTELSWVDARAASARVRAGRLDPPIAAWGSAPVGVVTLADEAPEPPAGPDDVWYEAMVTRLMAQISQIGGAESLRPAFEAGRAHIVGTSGTVTSLAGVHLGLPRYQRAKVDGVWLSVADCRAAIDGLRALSRDERAAHPCIGRDRADLVIPGCAILEAVFRLWPTTRIRVADRGLREGVLMTLIAKHKAAHGGGRR